MRHIGKKPGLATPAGPSPWRHDYNRQSTLFPPPTCPTDGDQLFSYKKCKIWQVSYVVHQPAIKRLIKNIGPIDESTFLYKIMVPKFPPFWNNELERLCLEYGAKTGKRRASLGYGDCRSNIIFQHGCPNNAPAILWSKGKHWLPLFPNRGIPLSLQNLFDSDVSNISIDSLFKSGQYKLALKLLYAFEKGGLSTALLNMLVVLGLLYKGVKAERLGQVTLLDIHQIEKVLRVSKKSGFLDAEEKLTPFGIDLLKRHKKELFIDSPFESVEKEGELYYPHTFLGCQRKFSEFPGGKPPGSN